MYLTPHRGGSPGILIDKETVISLATWIQYTCVTDGQKDRQTDTGQLLVVAAAAAVAVAVVGVDL